MEGEIEGEWHVRGREGRGQGEGWGWYRRGVRLAWERGGASKSRRGLPKLL